MQPQQNILSIDFFHYLCSPNTVRLVQLVEHQIVVLGVVGSSPTSHPNCKGDDSYGSSLFIVVVRRALPFPIRASFRPKSAPILLIGRIRAEKRLKSARFSYGIFTEWSPDQNVQPTLKQTGHLVSDIDMSTEAANLRCWKNSKPILGLATIMN